MKDPSTSPRPTWFADARRIIDITEVTPGLPLPSIHPARATFDYRHIAHAKVARESVACAVTVLSYAFKVTFTPRTEIAGDDTPRYLLEALLLSGLTLAIISRVELADGQDDRKDAPEMAGVAA